MRSKRFSALLLRCFAVLVLVISIISGGLACFAADGLDADLAGATRLTIIHTNDTHARAVEGEGIGFAKISAVVRETRKENPNVLVLDAGDTLHGQAIATLSRGESIIRLMNEIGYAAMAPGNLFVKSSESTPVADMIIKRAITIMDRISFFFSIPVCPFRKTID